MEAQRAARYGRVFSLAMLDVDHFKRVNDRFGHLVGDEVLKKLAGLLRSAVRGSDVLCRYGGEEFALLLPETAGPLAYRLCERLCPVVGRCQRSRPGDSDCGDSGIPTRWPPAPGAYRARRC